MARTLDIMGIARGVLGFTRSVLKDVTAELRKWATSPKNQKGVGVFAVFIIVMVGMFSYQASSIKLGAQFGPMQPSSGKPVSFTGWDEKTDTGTSTGTVGEESDTGTQKLQITDRNLAEVSFVLKWTDEADHDRLHENQPDELGIDVLAPWGVNQTQSAKNPQGGEGSVTVTFEVAQFKLNGDNGTGDWNYTVFAKACGEHTPKYVGILMWLDSGNSFSLEISWKYYAKPGTS